MSDFDLTGKVLLDTTALELMGGRLTGMLRGFSVAATAAFAIDRIIAWGHSAVDGAREMEAAERITAQAIKTTGGAANVTAAQIQSYAEALSNTTAIDDDVVHGAENLLLTFTEIKNRAGEGNDIFNQATKAALDMSVVFHEDANSAAVQLGKALQDPIAGATALRRVGVQLTEQQQEQIKTFVKSGDILSAQKIILGELSRETGGAAEAAADPFKRLVVILDNAKKEIGARFLIPALTPLVNMLARDLPKAIDVLNGAFVAFTATFKNLQAMFRAGLGGTYVAGQLGIVRQLFYDIGQTVAIIKIAILSFWSALTAGKSSADVTTALQNSLDAIARRLDEALVYVQIFFEGFANPNVKEANDSLGSFTFIVGQLVRDVLVALIDDLQKLAAFYKEHTTAVNDAVIAVIALVLAYRGIQAAEEAAKSINTFVDGVGKTITKVQEGQTELQKLGSKLSSLGSKTVDVAVSGVDKAKEALDGVKEALGKLEDKTVKVLVDYKEKQDAKSFGAKSGMSMLSGAFGGIGGALAGVLVGSETLAAVGTAVAELGAVIMAGIGAVLASPVLVPALIIAAVIAAAAFIYAFRKPIEKFFTEDLPRGISVLLDLGATLFDKGVEGLTALLNGAIAGFDAVARWFAALPGNIAYGLGYLLGTLFKGGVDLITGLWNGIQLAWTGIVFFFTNIVPTIIGWFADALSWLYNKGVDLLTGLWNGIQVGWTTTVNFFTNIGTTIIGWLGDALSWLYNKGVDLLTGLWNGIQFAWNNPVGFFTSLPGIVTGFLRDAASWLYNKGRDILTGLWNGIQDVWNTVTGFLTSVRNKVLDAVGKALDWLEQAGEDIINGLVNGVTKAWDKAVGKAKELGGDFIKGFKDAAGIKSPSSLMAEAGANIVDGLVIGIDSRRSVFDNRIAALAGSLSQVTDVSPSLTSADMTAALVGGGGSSKPLGAGDTYNVDVNITATDADSVRSVIPELVSAIRAGTGKS